MRVLAFDTATTATTVALADVLARSTGRFSVVRTENLPVDRGAALSFEARDDPAPGARPGHAQKLLTLIHAALDATGTSWPQIDRIAVGAGPGTFTGMRIGIATAQALAQATGIPLVGVSTLASLELAAGKLVNARVRGGQPSDPGQPAHGEGPVLAVLDARRGEAFVAGAGLGPQVLTPAALGDLAGQRASEGVIAVGDGAIKFRELLTGAGAQVPADDSPLHRVSAIHHCHLALSAQPNPANTVEPQYLRLPDAELSARR